jgi:ribonuclease VapC
MIAVDTSALMAILLNEPEADACMAALATADPVLISAGTLAEALIVAARRGIGEAMTRLIDGFGFEVVPVTATSARRIAHAYERWGKGMHVAALNFGDLFRLLCRERTGLPTPFRRQRLLGNRSRRRALTQGAGQGVNRIWNQFRTRIARSGAARSTIPTRLRHTAPGLLNGPGGSLFGVRLPARSAESRDQGGRRSRCKTWKNLTQS